MVLGKACNCKICSNYPAEVIGLREALGAGRLRLWRQLGGGARSGAAGTPRFAGGCAGAELPGLGTTSSRSRGKGGKVARSCSAPGAVL